MSGTSPLGLSKTDLEVFSSKEPFIKNCYFIIGVALATILLSSLTLKYHSYLKQRGLLDSIATTKEWKVIVNASTIALPISCLMVPILALMIRTLNSTHQYNMKMRNHFSYDVQGLKDRIDLGEKEIKLDAARQTAFIHNVRLNLSHSSREYSLTTQAHTNAWFADLERAAASQKAKRATELATLEKNQKEIEEVIEQLEAISAWRAGGSLPPIKKAQNEAENPELVATKEQAEDFSYGTVTSSEVIENFLRKISRTVAIFLASKAEIAPGLKRASQEVENLVTDVAKQSSISLDKLHLALSELYFAKKRVDSGVQNQKSRVILQEATTAESAQEREERAQSLKEVKRIEKLVKGKITLANSLNPQHKDLHRLRHEIAEGMKEFYEASDKIANSMRLYERRVAFSIMTQIEVHFGAEGKDHRNALVVPVSPQLH